MKNVILIAPPAAGKGTQSKLISEKYNLPHISTGDLLRESVNLKNELGNLIQEKMDKGELVTDDIVLRLLEERISRPDCSNGYILDGFPRNLAQAEEYLKLLDKLNYPLGDVIYLNIPEETARKRIVGRLSCSNCGAIYNDQFEDSKPLHFGTCDKCNGPLSKRSDDNDVTFTERFKTYKEQTYPLLQFFETRGMLFTVGSGISRERTFAEIQKILDRGNL